MPDPAMTTFASPGRARGPSLVARPGINPNEDPAYALAKARQQALDPLTDPDYATAMARMRAQGVALPSAADAARTATQGGGAAGGSGGGSAAGGADAVARSQAMQGLMSAINAVPTPSPIAPAPPVTRITPTGAQPAAEAASYGAARERIGLEGRAALKGLHSQMSARGIAGSGSEAAGTRTIFGNIQSGLSTVNRGLAEGSAQRAFQAEESDLSRAEVERQGNMNFSQAEAQRVQQAQQQRLAALAQAWGMAY